MIRKKVVYVLDDGNEISLGSALQVLNNQINRLTLDIKQCEKEIVKNTDTFHKTILYDDHDLNKFIRRVHENGILDTENVINIAEDFHDNYDIQRIDEYFTVLTNIFMQYKMLIGMIEKQNDCYNQIEQIKKELDYEKD